MHALSLASGLLIASLLGSPALAQAKKGSTPPARETVRYFQFSGDLLGEVPIDGILKEVRLGAKLVSAVLDVCHSIPNAEPRKDRFVVNLKVDGDRLTGTAQSQEEKVPVSVSLNRTLAGGTVSFTGFITQGQTRTEVSSSDNTDMGEDEFRENQPAEELIVAAPADFTEVSPGSIAVRVKRPSLLAVVNELRSQSAAVDLDSLTTECATLRTGEHVIRAEIDPERAAAILARLKAVPGVVNAGWTSGDYIIDSAVRIEAAAWRGADGRPDKSRLAAAIADSIARSLDAKVDATAWDAVRGELSIKLARPNKAVPQLNLTDLLEFVAVATPEKPGGDGALVIWLKYNGLETVDRGPEPHLKLMAGAGEREGPIVSVDELVRSLAHDLKGKYWDSNNSAWQ
jgi:hypothetical protein